MKFAFLRLSLERLASRHVLQSCRELLLLERFQLQMRRIRAEGGTLVPGKFPLNREKLITIEDRWYGAAIKSAGIRPGVLELIDYFHTMGLQQIIISDYVSAYKLNVLDLENRFASCYAGETIGHVKPSTELFRAVIDDLKIDPNRILHIGDSKVRDGVAALSAGCQFYFLGNQYKAPWDLLAAVTRG